MKNIIRKVVLLLSLLLILTSCKAKPVDENVAKDSEQLENKVEEMHTITDMIGNEVELKKDIKSIAITPIPWASLVYAIDGNSERIVAMNPSAMASYKISILPKLSPEMENVNVGIISKDFKINMEEMAKLKPDVVLVWDYQTDEIQQLKELGIPVVAIKYGTLESLQQGIELLGKVLGQEEKADEIIEYHKKNDSYFEAKANELTNALKPKVLYLRDKELKIFGDKSVNRICLDRTGGINVAKDAKDGTLATMEEVLNWDPEVIYLSNFDDFMPEDLYENKLEGQDWSNVAAIKNKRVYKTPIGIYRWDAPNVETPLMIEWMGKIQHPEIFNDYSFEENLKEFYKTFYDYELTQEEIDTITYKKANNY